MFNSLQFSSILFSNSFLLKDSARLRQIPTVVRDIIYGWARGFVGVGMASVFKPQTFTQEELRSEFSLFRSISIYSY